MLDNIKKDIEHFRAHGNSPWSSQGFWAVAIYRFGAWARSVRVPIIRQILIFMSLVDKKLIEMICGVSLPPTAQIGPGFFVGHFGAIVLHPECRLGENVAVYQGVTIGVRGDAKKAPRIGNNVNIGAGAKILGDVTVGDNVDIGANAVVLTDVPSDSIAVGIPAKAKPRKTRPPDWRFA